MRVAVVGLGYVGLVTAAGLAEWGHEVAGVETDEGRLASLLSGHLPLHEPGLDELVATHAASGALQFGSTREEVIPSAHVVMIAVGTASDDGGWQTADLLSCLADVVPLVADDGVLVIRSTLPPDSVRQLGSVVETVREAAGRPPIPLVLNPEFTREGTALNDFLHPDRVVIGVAADPEAHGVWLMRRLYRQVEAPIVVLRAVDAALTKLGANLFLATKIAFANELAALCDAFGGSVDDVVAAMAYDGRIGSGFLRAGVGFGGSCLPHQVACTVRTAQSVGLETRLLAAVHEINHRQRELFVDRIADLLGGELAGRRVGLLGLTFKPDTDDLREAPALAIAARLLERGASVVAYDPMERARRRAAASVPGLEVVESPYAALDGADIAGLVTEWPEFAALDWTHASSIMRRPCIVDGRNALPPASLLAAGFTYTAFGRGYHEPDTDGVPSPHLTPVVGPATGSSSWPVTAVGLRGAALLAEQ